jgi:penicillin-binding protein A
MGLSLRQRNLARDSEAALGLFEEAAPEPLRMPAPESPRGGGRRFGLSAFGLALLLGGLWLLPKPFEAVPPAAAELRPLEPPPRPFSTGELAAEVPGLLPLPWPVPPVFQLDDLTVRTSIDLPLQREMDAFLRLRRPAYAAVAAIRPSTGEVLCLSSYSYDRDWRERDMALYAGFPAASVFKLVTAAGVLAEGRRGRLDALDFVGSRSAAPAAWNLRTTASRRSHWVTLEQAFAGSINPVFGKLGLYDLGRDGLLNWAQAFGWNTPITDQLPVQPSLLGLTDDALAPADVGSGYTPRTTLSPLHGAAIAAAIINGGVFIRPGVVRSVVDGAGRVRYRRPEMEGRRILAPQTAQELGRMMLATIDYGTASRAFTGLDGTLARLLVGGKTGTLTGDSPPGVSQWLVGWALDPISGEKLAFAAVSLHGGRRAGVSAKELSKQLLASYFGARGAKASPASGDGVSSSRSQPLASLTRVTTPSPPAPARAAGPKRAPADKTKTRSRTSRGQRQRARRTGRS